MIIMENVFFKDPKTSKMIFWLTSVETWTLKLEATDFCVRSFSSMCLQRTFTSFFIDTKV